MKYFTQVGDQEYEIEIDRAGEVLVNGELYQVDFNRLENGGLLSLLINNISYEAVVDQRGENWEVLLEGELYSALVQDEWAYRMAQERGVSARDEGEAIIKSPMPGIIIAAPKAEGDTTEKGETIIILESMKMENELKAPMNGIVNRIFVEAGASVEKGQRLALIVQASEGLE